MDRCVNESYNGLRVNPKWIDTWTDDGCVGDGGKGWIHGYTVTHTINLNVRKINFAARYSSSAL